VRATLVNGKRCLLIISTSLKKKYSKDKKITKLKKKRLIVINFTNLCPGHTGLVYSKDSLTIKD